MNSPPNMIPPLAAPVRPWTVKALIAWGIAGAVWGVVVEGDWGLGDLMISPGLTLVLGWAMWNGARWAFSLTFAGTVLSGLFLASYVFIGSTRIGSTRIDLLDKTVWAVIIAVTVYLLFHPLTRQFIGVDKASRVQAPTGPPDRGGRVSQAVAISIFGLLAVSIPLLWAMGLIEGLLLMGAALACVGAGITVLVLSLPARDRDELSSS